MLKLVKTCGRQQLESVFSHLGPINNPTVHDENVTVHTDDGRFPAITELKNTFPWSHKPTKWTLSSASQNFTLFLLRIHINAIMPIICRCHTFKATKYFQPSDINTSDFDE